MWVWLLHIFGIDNPSGPWYAFWSGIGSDLGELALITAAFSFYWKHTCHVDGCWRLARHPVKGTDHVVCRRHHPDNRAPTAEDVLADHRRANP